MNRRLSYLINAALLAVILVLVVVLMHDCTAPRGDLPPADSRAQPRLPMVTLRVGDVALEVEVADEPEEQRMGYMFRERPETTGMLFVFPDEDLRSFWMANTLFDIDLAYIRADGRIAQTVRMISRDRRSAPSSEPVKYVLEVPAGWFARHGTRAGTVVEIPPGLEAKD